MTNYILLATQVPEIRVASDLVLAATAQTTPGGTAPGFVNFSTGESSGFTGAMNNNSQRGDLLARFGGGGNAYAVADGLTLTYAGGFVSIAPGHALIEGLIEVPATITGVAVTFGSTAAYIWLKQTGVAVCTTTTPPSGVPACYIGCVTPSDGMGRPIQVDMSGVLAVTGSMLLRVTADSTQPTDTPPAGAVFLTRTQGGTYLWDGASYFGLGGSGGGTVYFAALPHDVSLSTPHDSYRPDNGPHVSTTDRANIAANTTSTAAALAAADAAQTDADTALAAASAAATLAAAAVQTTDSRLSDARTPLAHASTHYISGSDPLHIVSAQIDDFLTAVGLAANSGISRLSSPPSGATDGTLYYDTTLVAFGFRVGGTWKYFPTAIIGALAGLSDVLLSSPALHDILAYNTGAAKWENFTASALGLEQTANKGVASGYASLDGSGKVPTSQLPATVTGSLTYKGLWNASTNSPALASGVGTLGFYYVVSVAGSTTLDGISTWNVADVAIYNGTMWNRLIGSSNVVSVNGLQGAVVTTYSQVIGDGVTKSIPVSHSLGTQDVTVSVRDASSNETILVDWQATSTSSITVQFAAPPPVSSYRVTVSAA